MRERSFLRSNQRVVRLRELTDWIALRADEVDESLVKPVVSSFNRGERFGTRRSQSRMTVATLDEIAPEVSLSQVRALEDAGWVFIPRSAIRPGEHVHPAKVFLERGDRLALATNKAIIKLRKTQCNEVSLADLLSKYGCRVLSELSFSPGTFRIAVLEQADRDTLDVANQLVKDDVAEYAEPELIEMIGAR